MALRRFRHRRKQWRKKPKVSKKIKDFVKRAIDVNQENKFVKDWSRAGAAIAYYSVPYSSYSVRPLFATNASGSWDDFLRGVGPGERIGNRIRLKSLEYRFVFLGNGTSVNDQFARVILVMVKNPLLSGVPSITNLLSTAVQGNEWLSPINPNARSAVSILLDKTVRLEVGGGSTNTLARKEMIIKYNFRDHIMQFNDTANASITTVMSGLPLLYVFGSEPTNYITMAYNGITYYEDA